MPARTAFRIFCSARICQSSPARCCKTRRNGGKALPRSFRGFPPAKIAGWLMSCPIIGGVSGNRKTFPVVERHGGRSLQNAKRGDVPPKVAKIFRSSSANGKDRGRRDRLPGLPSLRTGRAGFPHPALRLMVLPLGGLNETNVGCIQGKQPCFVEIGIRPTLVIFAASSSAPALALAQHAA
jgi:hypothetical protein